MFHSRIILRRTGCGQARANRGNAANFAAAEKGGRPCRSLSRGKTANGMRSIEASSRRAENLGRERLPAAGRMRKTDGRRRSRAAGPRTSETASGAVARRRWPKGREALRRRRRRLAARCRYFRPRRRACQAATLRFLAHREARRNQAAQRRPSHARRRRAAAGPRVARPLPYGTGLPHAAGESRLATVVDMLAASAAAAGTA